jgi:glycosyltransferase involved in cell wall biosynthesis
MTDPPVSVVLPTYGRPDRLRRAAESVVDQTYGNVELVVVDDCSPTPATESLASVDLDGIELSCFRHEENRGANVARNTGIRNAAGTYIAFLDDDDEWKPAKLERQVETFERGGPDLGVVYTGSEFRYGDYTRTVTYTSSGDVTTDILVGRSFGKFSSLMIRRDVIDQAGLPDPDLPSWQERDWLLRLSEHCTFEPVAEPLTVRWCGEDDRIADNFEAKRDVTYPRFLEKHRDLAASYGRRYERRFVASLADMLGRSALKNGYYADARKYLLRACYCYPFETKRFVYALASLGGAYSYESIRRVVHAVHRNTDRTTVR